MKTIVGVNTLENISPFVYSSHCKMWCEIMKAYPEDEFLFYTPYRMSIDNMRNDVARVALSHNCDYIMFIDDDVIVEPTVYKQLREADKPIVAAMAYVRGYPFHPMFFKDLGTVTEINGKRRKNVGFHDDYEKDVDPETGLVQTGAVGFSCVLIKTEIVRAMSPPYFVTGPGHTEDVYFCLKATLELDPEPGIFVQTRCKTGHLMMPDAVSSENVEVLRKYYKPEHDEDGAIKFRMKDYIRNVIQELA